MSVLRESASTPAFAEATHSPPSSAILFGITVALIVATWILWRPLLMPLGVLIFLAGRLWFAAQILREMTFPAAMAVFFIPFMPTLFFFKRFDIVWRPFLLGLLGIVVVILGRVL